MSRFRKRVVKEQDEKEQEDANIDVDYIVDEKAKTATLTSRGVKKAEEFSNCIRMDTVSFVMPISSLPQRIYRYPWVHFAEVSIFVREDGARKLSSWQEEKAFL